MFRNFAEEQRYLKLLESDVKEKHIENVLKILDKLKENGLILTQTYAKYLKMIAEEYKIEV